MEKYCKGERSDVWSDLRLREKTVISKLERIPDKIRTIFVLYCCS
jgi:hypothetical protein